MIVGTWRDADAYHWAQSPSKSGSSFFIIPTGGALAEPNGGLHFLFIDEIVPLLPKIEQYDREPRRNDSAPRKCNGDIAVLGRARGR